MGNRDDDIWDLEPEPRPEAGQPTSSPASTRSPGETKRNPFIDAYMKSIQPARDIICGQWRECEWDEKGLSIEAPSTSDEVCLLNILPIFFLLFLLYIVVLVLLLILLLFVLHMQDGKSIGQFQENHPHDQGH